MNKTHSTTDAEQTFSVRGTAKLLNASSARYADDWNSMPHAHSYMELFYITGGKGQFLIQDRLYPVNVNDLVIINPNVLHTEVSIDTHPMEYIVLGIEGLELTAARGFNGQFALLDHFESAEISGCLRNILREKRQKDTGYEEICQAYLEILILRLMRNAPLSVPVEPQTAAGNRQCAAVRRYIDLHYKNQLTLDQLAEEAHMNKYYLSHSFKEEYGVSPINYMISRRIEESKHLLAETDLSTSQIAQLLGFSSLSYFSQVFRRTQSMTPMEFRQKSKNY